jgi:pilus assembly protein Flp/PilA
MRNLKSLARRFAGDARGATSIEYGLIAVLIAVGAIGAMQALGGGVGGSWGATSQKVSDAMKTAGQ